MCERNLFKGFEFSDERYTQNWTPVEEGEVIGRYQDGQEVRVQQSGYLIFVAGKHTLHSNQALYYLAVLQE